MTRIADDITGNRYGSLVALYFDSSKWKGNSQWMCQCDCGEKKLVLSCNLKSGHTKSCGCKSSYRRNSGGGRDSYYKFNTWSSIVDRVTNPKNKRFKDYGGRGIGISSQWLCCFEIFDKDTGDRPTDSHSIDRINNNGPYSKENFRWATHSEQKQNAIRNKEKK